MSLAPHTEHSYSSIKCQLAIMSFEIMKFIGERRKVTGERTEERQGRREKE